MATRVTDGAPSFRVSRHGHSRARALRFLNRKKKRDCSQSRRTFNSSAKTYGGRGTNHLHWKTGNSGWKIKWVAPFRLLGSFRKYELSLRSRRLEVVGERENGRARGRHARGATSPLACLLLARPFFLVPTTSKRLLRRLIWAVIWGEAIFLHFLVYSTDFNIYVAVNFLCQLFFVFPLY